MNPEDCSNSAFLRKLNGVAPQGDGSNDETPGATGEPSLETPAEMPATETPAAMFQLGTYGTARKHLRTFEPAR